MGSGLNAVRIKHLRFFEAGFPRLLSTYENWVQESLAAWKKFLEAFRGQVCNISMDPK